MKLAVLSDIHGNIWALDAVLADASRQGVDGYVNLGDILYGPLAPLETYDRLAGLRPVTVRGNEDRILYELTEEDPEPGSTLDSVRRVIGGEILKWLESLPSATELHGALLVHGTPVRDDVYLLEDVGTGEPELRDEETIATLLDGARHPVVLCGHSHVPRAVSLASGQLVVNPGSVGLPAYIDETPLPHSMQNGSPAARYAILEKNAGGWRAGLRSVDYDYEQAVRRAAANKRLDWAWWLGTGRARAG